MRLLVHVGRLIADTLRFGIATRRLTLVLVVVIGLALIALALTAQVVAPVAIYPFA